MPTDKIYTIIRDSILGKLAEGLAPDLYYHCPEHTIDVERQAVRIARNEDINGRNLFLLRLACLYHDSGFLTTYAAHELAGCTFARQELTAFGIPGGDIDIVCGMIMATRIPQTPMNKLEEIICDADLDYLGREDFSPISHQLYEELKVRGMIRSENDWNLVQIKFFEQHSFFTDSTRALREPIKLVHLEEIKAQLEQV